LVEDIKNQSEIEGEEEDTTKIAVEGHPTIDQKRKASDATKITLLYIPDVMVTVEDMLGKVPKLRYFDHDVRYAKKFSDLV